MVVNRTTTPRDQTPSHHPRDLDLKSNVALSLAVSGSLEAAMAPARDAAEAPAALAVHRRNFVLATTLARGPIAGGTLRRRLLGDQTTGAILARAAAIRAAPDALARTRALSTFVAPPPRSPMA